MGEGGAEDEKIMPLISSCNIACGGHAGDADTIEKTVALALKNGVHIGAHPSYPDRQYFGRQRMEISEQDLKESLDSQIRRVREEAAAQGGVLHHVKAHGALYNDLKTDKRKAELLISLIEKIDKGIKVFVPPKSVLKEKAGKRVKVWVEGFADRTYEQDFSLTPRSFGDALLTDKEEIFMRVKGMALKGQLKTRDGKILTHHFDTICVHSDTPGSLDILRYLNKRLPEAGIKVKR